jgi:hypothetical protein
MGGRTATPRPTLVNPSPWNELSKIGGGCHPETRGPSVPGVTTVGTGRRFLNSCSAFRRVTAVFLPEVEKIVPVGYSWPYSATYVSASGCAAGDAARQAIPAECRVEMESGDEEMPVRTIRRPLLAGLVLAVAGATGRDSPCVQPDRLDANLADESSRRPAGASVRRLARGPRIGRSGSHHAALGRAAAFGRGAAGRQSATGIRTAARRCAARNGTAAHVRCAARCRMRRRPGRLRYSRPNVCSHDHHRPGRASSAPVLLFLLLRSVVPAVPSPAALPDGMGARADHHVPSCRDVRSRDGNHPFVDAAVYDVLLAGPAGSVLWRWSAASVFHRRLDGTHRLHGRPCSGADRFGQLQPVHAVHTVLPASGRAPGHIASGTAGARCHSEFSEFPGMGFQRRG